MIELRLKFVSPRLSRICGHVEKNLGILRMPIYAAVQYAFRLSYLYFLVRNRAQCSYLIPKFKSFKMQSK
jgi:hypothetical protein